MVLPALQVWLDPIARAGPEAMAVDEWLLETAEVPVLRCYGWAGDWGSIGYFGRHAGAAAAIPEVSWVRRWTGGGMVDHRADWTYSLVVPAQYPLAKARSAESYRAVHAALAEALAKQGRPVRMSGGEWATGMDFCFQNPVRHDLVDERGEKIAGAGQRRSLRGLLHQGSVSRSTFNEIHWDRATLAVRLAHALADEVKLTEIKLRAAEIQQISARRYADPSWLCRR